MKSNVLIAQAAGILLLLLSALTLTAGPHQAGDAAVSSPKHQMATRQVTQGIPHFGKITPNLYRGGRPSGAGLELLQTMGVQIVVDMRGLNKSEKAAVEKLGMEYVPIAWHCPFPSDKPFVTFLKLIQDNPEKKVFVHCRLGDDRTGMAVAAYRMADEGWSADEAMNEMKTFGFTGVHHGICPGLAHYEKTFPRRLKTSAAFKDLQIAHPAEAERP